MDEVVRLRASGDLALLSVAPDRDSLATLSLPLRSGARAAQGVSFQRHQIIDIIWAQPDRTPKVLNPRRTYCERCLVDDDVLNQRAKVRYLYREAPDLAAPDDEYPDSGWRIRAPMAYVEGVNTTEAHYVALGAV